MSSSVASDPLADLTAAGVSIWLDDLSRELLAGGELEKLIADRHVVGVTTNPTIFASAVKLWDAVREQNLFVKIPATRAGLTAITEVVAHGISVNVTLIFSLDRYRAVMDAHAAGLERARQAGRSARCGRPPASRTRPSPTRCTSASWPSRAP